MANSIRLYLLAFLLIFWSYTYSVIEISYSEPEVIDYSNLSISNIQGLTIGDINDIEITEKKYKVKKIENELIYENITNGKKIKCSLGIHNYFNIEHIDQDNGHSFALIDNQLLVIGSENDTIKLHRIDLVTNPILSEQIIFSLEINRILKDSKNQISKYNVQYSLPVELGQDPLCDFESNNGGAPVFEDYNLGEIRKYKFTVTIATTHRKNQQSNANQSQKNYIPITLTDIHINSNVSNITPVELNFDDYFDQQNLLLSFNPEENQNSPRRSLEQEQIPSGTTLKTSSKEPKQHKSRTVKRKRKKVKKMYKKCLYHCGNAELTLLENRTEKRTEVNYDHCYCSVCFTASFIPTDPKRITASRKRRDPVERKKLKESWNIYYSLVRKENLSKCNVCQSNLHVYCKGVLKNKYLFICKNCNCQLLGSLVGERIKVVPFYQIKRWQKEYKKLQCSQNKESENIPVSKTLEKGMILDQTHPSELLNFNKSTGSIDFNRVSLYLDNANTQPTILSSNQIANSEVIVDQNEDVEKISDVVIERLLSGNSQSAELDYLFPGLDVFDNKGENQPLLSKKNDMQKGKPLDTSENRSNKRSVSDKNKSASRESSPNDVSDEQSLLKPNSSVAQKNVPSNSGSSPVNFATEKTVSTPKNPATPCTDLDNGSPHQVHMDEQNRTTKANIVIDLLEDSSSEKNDSDIMLDINSKKALPERKRKKTTSRSLDRSTSESVFKRQKIYKSQISTTQRRHHKKERLACPYHCGSNELTLLGNYTKGQSGLNYNQYYCSNCFSKSSICTDSKANSITRRKRVPKDRHELVLSWINYYLHARNEELPECEVCDTNLHVSCKGSYEDTYKFYCKNCCSKFTGSEFDEYIDIIPFNKTQEWKR